MVLATALRTGLARDAVASSRGYVAVGARYLSAVAQKENSTALYTDAVLQAPETKVQKLDNGVTVATELGKGKLACISVTLDVGSRYENMANNGACAVLGAAGFAGKEAEVAAMGGRFFAHVDRETLTYRATVEKADVPKAMKILASAAKASDLTSETVVTAKESVLRSLETARAKPEVVLMDHLHDAAFIDTAMGMPSLGSAESVQSLELDALKAFSSKHTAGSRVIVAGAGALDRNALADMSGDLLGDIPSTPSGSIDEQLQPAYFLGTDKRIRFDSKPAAHIAFAFKAPPAHSGKTVAIQLMQAVLGSYDEKAPVGKDAGTKWCQDIAELNIAKKAAPFYLGYKDIGLFGVSGIMADNCLENYMWYTLYNLVYLCHKLTDKELDFAKVRLKASILNQRSGCEAAVADMAKQVHHYGRRMSPAESMARIDALNTNDIKAVAHEIINDQDHALVGVGPLHELPDYNWIRRRSYWLRY